MCLAGMIIAYKVTNRIHESQLAAGELDGNVYLLTFIGIVLAFTIGGFLIYGATRIQPIESFEGVFGFLMGGALGWGIARFIFVYIVFYLGPESAWYGQIMDNSAIAWDIYLISPYYYLVNSPIPQQLLNPKL